MGLHSTSTGLRMDFFFPFHKVPEALCRWHFNLFSWTEQTKADRPPSKPRDIPHSALLSFSLLTKYQQSLLFSRNHKLSGQTEWTRWEHSQFSSNRPESLSGNPWRQKRAYFQSFHSFFWSLLETALWFKERYLSLAYRDVLYNSIAITHHKWPLGRIIVIRNLVYNTTRHRYHRL